MTLKLTDQEKNEFVSRVDVLGVDVSDVKRVEVETPWGENDFELPNRPGKSNSMKIYMAFGMQVAPDRFVIDQHAARKIEQVYGNTLVRIAGLERGEHPAIDLVDLISSGRIPEARINVVRHPSIETLPQDRMDILNGAALKYGTPIFVYFERDLIDNANSFLNMMPSDLTVRYAMKANSNSSILSLLNRSGLHFDASTIEEAERAMLGPARIPGDRIRLTGQRPVSEEDLSRLLSMGVKYTACSLEQLRTFGEAMYRCKVGVRINLGISSGWTPHTATGGKNSPFGIPYEKKSEIDELVDKYDLLLDTLHFHIGSGSDPNKQREAVVRGLEIVAEYPGVKTLNVGGGFKIARMNYEHATDIKEMGRVISGVVENFRTKTGRSIKIEVEPGTGIVGNAGYIVTTVVDKKDTHPNGEEFLILNGGINMNDRTERYGAQHPLFVISRDDKPRKIREYVVVGPCCESGDVITVRPGNSGMIDPRRMIETHIGDIVVVGGAGAYCAAMAGGNYNSQPLRKEILVRRDGETIQEIRAEQPLSDLSKYEVVPEDLK